jgi:predicted unusual protein kinase regulating ubiquinone biosynthesis (AarF/ABC1/UbiB family)
MRSVKDTRHPLVRTLVVLWAAIRVGLELWWLERRCAHLPEALARQQRESLFAAQALRLRLLMTELQGLWIKLGQFLSTRADVLPAAYTREFARLQDLVPPFPGEKAIAAVAEAFGRPATGPGGLFAIFERTPVAAASLGQVHRAWVPASALPKSWHQRDVGAEAIGQEAAALDRSTGEGDRDAETGRPGASVSAGGVAPEASHGASDGTDDPTQGLVPVAVKVLRPGIERAVAADLSALLWIVRGTDRWTRLGRRVDLYALHAEVADVTRQEMDYRLEAEHARRFRENLQGQKGLRAPHVFPEWTSRRVLVMEYVSGLRIDRPDELRAAGVEPRAVAALLARSYVRQVLQDGFFHADPHPGNLFVTPRGELIFIDFGMMASIRPDERGHIARLISGAITRDYDAILAAMGDLGFLRPGARVPVLRKALSLALDQLSGIPLERPDSAEFRAFLEEMREFLYTEPFQLPARYAYLGRALGILLGIVTTLDPDIQMLPLLREAALPLLGLQGEPGPGRAGSAPAGSLLGGALGGLLGGPLGDARETLLALYRLPRRLDRLVERLDDGELHVQADLAGLQRRVEGWARAMRGLADHVLAGVSAICATLFTIAHRPLYADGAWVAAALLLLAGWRTSRRT